MPLPIRILLKIENKELLKTLSHISHRYAQAILKNNTLRYYRSGVMLKDSDTSYDSIQLRFSTKRGIESPHVRKSDHKTFIPFIANVNEIEFNGSKFESFCKRIGIELMTIDSCEIDIETGRVVLLGEIDSELSMSTFEIGYPLGQQELVRI